MLFDPLYWLVIGVGIVLSLGAQAMVKGAFAKYSKVPTSGRRTGADIANAILRSHGIHDVKVEPVRGQLTDHYDPSTKTLRLSEPVYRSQSVAAAGIAAHEVGHAIQHAHGYAPLEFRSLWVPIASTGGGLSMLVIFLALILGGGQTALGETVGWIGVLMFAATTVFTLITLPVEFNASKRALATLRDGNLLLPEELGGARKVLNAAALTYVAAFAQSVMMLIYWIMALGLGGGRGGEE